MKTLYVELDSKHEELLAAIQLRTGFSVKQASLEGLIMFGQRLEIISDRIDFLANGVSPAAIQE
ncbi:MAG: hypothetical protein A2283_15775 [Lentisphaerae bacterium RIFOXYA12_FULL_48_11]|nr:MAG: hypothetical protein A2283_15775 [Lentisphaerae bacterium RIFOXYA12_FULL_48_11]